MDARYYIPVSIGILILAVFVYYRSLDRHHTNIRKLVIIAVMSAVATLGRFLFAAIPGFSPMAAVVILTGIYFGAEAGILCGTLAAFLSNFYFGQGPWTPFQMVILGLTGAVSAFVGPVIRKNGYLILPYGLICGVVYSLFMDIWTVLWSYGSFTPQAYLVAITAAVPYTIYYALANVIFLFLMLRPFGRKLARVSRQLS